MRSAGFASGDLSTFRLTPRLTDVLYAQHLLILIGQYLPCGAGRTRSKLQHCPLKVLGN